MFLIVKPANGSPSTVGIDMSTTHRRRFVSEPDDVACAAEDGRIMCWLAIEEMATDLEDENDGLRILVALLLVECECTSELCCCLSEEGMATPFGGVAR